MMSLRVCLVVACYFWGEENCHLDRSASPKCAIEVLANGFYKKSEVANHRFDGCVFLETERLVLWKLLKVVSVLKQAVQFQPFLLVD